jgi:uncharacterized protein (TIGR00661 family)
VPSLKRKRVLYSVQGTGNGHVARARQIIPLLQKMVDVDVWIGGTQSEVALPVQPKYKALGLVMHYNKTGGVSIIKTVFKNNYIQIIRDILSAPVKNYDVVLNDFEFITAWACKLRRVNCISLSHQAAFRYTESPRPKIKNLFGEFILRWYAPASAYHGFHFQAYQKNIHPPVIRNEIRQLEPNTENYITVYLPAYHHELLIRIFKPFDTFTFEVFSKHTDVLQQLGNVLVKPISNEAFIQSFKNSFGVICGAGFETPAEALFLGKRLLVVPINRQYEQSCNATALAQLGEGVTVVNKLDVSAINIIGAWLKSKSPSRLYYPDFIEELLQSILKDIPSTVN